MREPRNSFTGNAYDENRESQCPLERQTQATGGSSPPSAGN